MNSIIIPTNNASCANACIEAVKRNEPFIDPWHFMPVLDGISPADILETRRLKGATTFCFATNINRGIQVSLADGYDGVILLNHDALLETPGGFSSLIASCTPEYGLVSAAVNGACCNDAQDWRSWSPDGGRYPMIDTDLTVAFVAVYIPRRTLDAIGLLDETLTGYGYDDDLYCTQVRAAGLKVGVWHECVVEHGSLPSSFRTNPGCHEAMQYNHKRYHEIIAERGLTAHSTHHGWCKETFGL